MFHFLAGHSDQIARFKHYTHAFHRLCTMVFCLFSNRYNENKQNCLPFFINYWAKNLNIRSHNEAEKTNRVIETQTTVMTLAFLHLSSSLCVIVILKVNNVIAVCSKYVCKYTPFDWTGCVCKVVKSAIDCKTLFSGVWNQYCLRSFDGFFFAQRFLFQIIISTQRLMKLYFIYILFAICSLNAS